MAFCKSNAMSVISATFNGFNLDVVTKNSSFDLGGSVGSDGVTTISGRYFKTNEVMPSEVTLSVVLNSEFNIKNFNGCGDLVISTSTGQRFLFTNSSLSETIKLSDDKPSVELKFKGDVGIMYS